MSLKLLLSGSQDLTAIQTLRSVIYVSACVHKDACVDVREFLCNQVAVNMCGPDKPGNIHPAKMQALFQTSSVTEHSGLIITSNRRGSDITLHCYKVHACDSTTQGTHPTGNREDLITAIPKDRLVCWLSGECAWLVPMTLKRLVIITTVHVFNSEADLENADAAESTAGLDKSKSSSTSFLQQKRATELLVSFSIIIPMHLHIFALMML